MGRSYLFLVSTKMIEYFAYSFLWIGLVSEVIALSVLFLRRRSRVQNTNYIYLFKWQYSVGMLYILNMIFNNENFSDILFGYQVQRGLPDAGCKIQNFANNLILCSPSWMQVVRNNSMKKIHFD